MSDKYCMISLIHGLQKTKQMNKHNKIEADSWETKQVVVEGGGSGGLEGGE